MRLLLCSVMFLSITSLMAQSKKELLSQVASLKAEIAELKKPKDIDLTDKHLKASYGLGVLIGSNVKMQGGDSLNLDALVIGLRDIVNDSTLKMPLEECGMLVQQYMQDVATMKSAKAKAEGLAFLEANKTKEGVTVTESGLQYKVVTAGTGKTPGPEDNVTVHYTGKLTDGTVFDSSVERGEPISFDVSGVISGWTEALQLMKEGDKWIIYIPSELGYGERGAGGQIPPNAVLIFEVELLKVN